MRSLQQDTVKLYEMIEFLEACGGKCNGRNQQNTVVSVVNRNQEEYKQNLVIYQTFSQAEKK